MKFFRPLASLLGIVACAPLVYSLFLSLEPLWLPPKGTPSRVLFGSSLSIEIAATALVVLLVTLCISLVYRLPSIAPEKRRAWVLFLITYSLIAVPLFWYLHIFHTQPDHVSHTDL